MDLYADIIVDISLKQLDKTFQYRVPKDLVSLVSPGSLVNVPFGNGGRMIEGVVLSLSDVPKIDASKIKDIDSMKKGAVSAEEQMISLAAWISRNYGSTMIQALKTVMPVKKAVRKRGKAKDFEVESVMPQGEGFEGADKVALNPAQNTAADKVLSDYNNGERKTYLLHGVTGSGKTEVYMRLIEEMLKKGKETIVLIPEIALTYQTVNRFTARFKDEVLIMHSRLSAGERYEQFEDAREGRKKIMVGPRSALFTPFKNLGLIIIDEEHEQSYKSEQVPRYHARETAIERARLSNASVVLGSATPAVESYEKALTGEYTLLELPERVMERNLPECEIIDLRSELKRGNRSMIGKKLHESIQDRLDKKEQVMLFLNRRGMIGSVSCRACGHVIKCPHCDVPMTLHRNRMLTCHYCGHIESAKPLCPKCGSKYIGGFKAGTEKVEESVQKMFPNAKILRMDADTTKGKTGHETILKKFASHKADILIGTQMIVKGHDFPNVTLVGILAADLSLNENDYRGAERTFQLLTQAAGRAGRGDTPGAVIIQTYQPEHYAVTCAAAQDYKGFFEKEIAYRKLGSYPPASHLLLIMVTSQREAKADTGIGLIYEHITKLPSKCDFYGPMDANVKKIADTYRKIIYIKSKDYDLLVDIKDRAEDLVKDFPAFRDTLVYFDFDPMNGF